MYKFYLTSPIYARECDGTIHPTGETATKVFEVPGDSLQEFKEYIDISGFMIKEGTNIIVHKPKKGFVSRLCDLIKDSLSD